MFFFFFKVAILCHGLLSCHVYILSHCSVMSSARNPSPASLEPRSVATAATRRPNRKTRDSTGRCFGAVQRGMGSHDHRGGPEKGVSKMLGFCSGKSHRSKWMMTGNVPYFRKFPYELYIAKPRRIDVSG